MASDLFIPRYSLQLLEVSRLVSDKNLFVGLSYGDSFKAQKLNYDSLIALIDLNYLKNGNFQL